MLADLRCILICRAELYLLKEWMINVFYNIDHWIYKIKFYSTFFFHIQLSKFYFVLFNDWYYKKIIIYSYKRYNPNLLYGKITMVSTQTQILCLLSLRSNLKGEIITVTQTKKEIIAKVSCIVCIKFINLVRM